MSIAACVYERIIKLVYDVHMSGKTLYLCTPFIFKVLFLVSVSYYFLYRYLCRIISDITSVSSSTNKAVAKVATPAVDQEG